MQTSKVLAAELATWNNGRGISPLDWIINTGSFAQFTAYARLIFPEFVEVQGRLYLADLFTQERLGELRKGSDDRNAQTFMNVIDLATMFCDADEQSDDEVRELGRFLKKTWTASAAASFPHRQIQIILYDNLEEEGVGELLISLVDVK